MPGVIVRSRRGCIAMLTTLLASVAASGAALAHIPLDIARGASGRSALAQVGIPMLVAALLYATGAARVWARSMHGRRLLAQRAAAFAAGLAALALALLSPLDAWGAELFSMHMAQHEILMLVAAPLLVLGRPLPLFLWAFRGTWREALTRWIRARWMQQTWAALIAAGTAWVLHALALWVWHVPQFFAAVLRSSWIHDLQHFSFLATALLFWSALLHENRQQRRGAAILYLFTTTVHTGVLGALITLAAHPWYSPYLQTSPRWGLTPLEDQQLGGLIMWVPGSLVYIGAALVLLARYLGESWAHDVSVPTTDASARSSSRIQVRT
jgi:putative membrane protein